MGPSYDALPTHVSRDLRENMAAEGERSKQSKERENAALQSGLRESGHEAEGPERAELTLTDRLNARLLLSLQHRLSQAQDGFLRRVQEAAGPGETGDSNRRQEEGDKEEEDW